MENRSLVWRSALTNGSILSGVYLCVGLLTETLRRVWPMPWVLKLSLALDALPARVLNAFGLLTRLRDAYGWDRVSAVELRLVFAGTTMAIIFALALVLGSTLWTFQRLWTRRRA